MQWRGDDNYMLLKTSPAQKNKKGFQKELNKTKNDLNIINYILKYTYVTRVSLVEMQPSPNATNPRYSARLCSKKIQS